MTKFTYKFKVGEAVLVKNALANETFTRCKIVDRGFDDKDVAWYSCIPLEFNCSVSREFSEDRIVKLNE